MRVFVLCLFASLGVGCANTVNQRSATRQGASIDELIRQQVIDNVAKFAQDPGAFPHLSLPTMGSSGISQGAGIGNGLFFNPFELTSWSLSPTASRNHTVGWTMEPVTDPDAIRRMRAAYLQAVSNPNWFCRGCRSDVPHRQPCMWVGHHCGTYVWVTPGCGTEELTNLTLAVLEAALYEPDGPPAPAMKKVEKLYEFDGTMKKLVQEKETYEEKIVKASASAEQSTGAPKLKPRSNRLVGPGPLGIRQSLDILAPQSNR